MSQLVLEDELPVVDAHDLIDTMKLWLDGEPVWTHARIIEVAGAEFRYRYPIASARGLQNIEQLMNRNMMLMQLRDRWIAQFGFAIPCAEMLDELTKSKLVVEVGAGSGYMTRLMRHRGIKVIGSDPFESIYAFKRGQFDPAQLRLEGKTMVRRYPEATVFCSWPSLKESWFRQMLKAMRIGQRLIVIREDACAEETAWEYLDDCFEQETTITIPTFQYIHDFAQVLVKKRQQSK